ncbi:MAG: dihydrodipicolinate synthase family protein [candidate division NC10 bacterium]|nr:dihydrodipicolinate synthase family protein [candidate division NC10 bacterium]
MKPLHGILAATVTPMGRTGAVDLGALAALVEFLVGAGVHGLFVLASQGEFYSLDRVERRRVTRAAVRAARGRVPVVVNTGTVSTDATLALSREAEGEGVDALGPITPFYLKPTPQELFEHYRRILKAVRCPVYAYNNPARAGGVGLDAATVTRLAKGSLRFAGIFDATGNLQAARRYARLQGGRFGYFVAGQLDLAAAMRVGAKGAVLATANAAPREFVHMYEASRRGDMAEAERLRRRLEPLHELFRTGPFPGTMKACLELSGIPVGLPRRPALPASPEVKATAARILERLRARRGTGS